MLIVNLDGAARGNPGPAGYGICVYDENEELIDQAYGYIGKQTNNVAEYTAMIALLDWAKIKGWKELTIRSDSQLMVKQLSGEYRVKNEVLAKLYTRVKLQLKFLTKYKIVHVKREFNKCADKMANKAVDDIDSDPLSINPMPVD
jgi:ribonuclease HI